MFKMGKNLLGTVRGFGCCPNCGDCWSWKASGSIIYETFDQYNASGVMICNECLENPDKLDVDRIAAKLTTYGWGSDDVLRVRTAISSNQIEVA